MSVSRQISTSKSPSNFSEEATNYWAQTPEQLFKELQTSSQGLSQTNAEQRFEKYGPNMLKARQELSPLRLFINQFKSPIVLILSFATLLSAFLQDWADAIIIMLIIIGSALLSFVQEYNAHNAADKLRAQLTIKSQVMRDGKKREIPTGQASFHTGWFIESVLSASLVVFAIRTRLPFLRSHPSRAMILVTVMVGLVAMVVPYSPLAGIMGFKPLGLTTLGLIFAIIILYFISAELVKGWFYHHFSV
jgi:magnesium-transporting ATPase (P-type)